MDLSEFLSELVKQGGSDLFVSVDSAPLIKVEGQMRPLGSAPLDFETNHQLIYSILSDRDIVQFEGSHELNKSLKIPNVGRFRVNVFRQRGEPALVARHIKDRIPTIEQLGLPDALKQIVMEERGLVLVVGGTGTGKSTTLAAMIDYRNAERTGHILTIEDPIEFVYKNKKALVNQREVGLDTESFDAALKNAMREAPDVILIGEIRDPQTMKQAIAYSETGHLCLATLHANNANQALDRVINFFGEEAKHQLLLDLSLNLKAVISQRLCKGVDDKRVPAVELMVVTPFIGELIEKGRLSELKDAMERSKGRVSKTFDQALFHLVQEGKIDQTEALRHADSRNNLALRFRLEKTGSDQGLPITSEFTLDKRAPFDQYETFCISPIKVAAERPEGEALLTASLRHALTQKGLREDPYNADIDVQFVLGIKTTSGLSLTPVADEGEVFQHYQPESERHVMLVVNIVDQRSRRPIYRLTASRHDSEHRATQEESNRDLTRLLSTFPVGRHERGAGSVH